MAEYILKALVKAKGLEELFYVESAAVSTEEIGNPIYPPAKRCLTQHGVWFDPGKRARQVTPSDYDRFGRIIGIAASAQEAKTFKTGKAYALPKKLRKALNK